MATGFRKILEGLRLIPKAASTASEKGDLDVTTSSGKLNYHNGTSASPVVTEDHSATLINKTLDDAIVINDITLDTGVGLGCKVNFTSFLGAPSYITSNNAGTLDLVSTNGSSINVTSDDSIYLNAPTGSLIITTSGIIDVTNSTIINLTDPNNASDAATKQYVDAVNYIQATTSVGLAVGNLVYVDNTGVARKLDAADDTKVEFVGVVSSIDGGNAIVQISGPITITAASFTVGKPVYANPATPGALTSTVPSNAGQWIIPVGIAISATKIVINAAGSATAVKITSDVDPYVYATVTSISANTTLTNENSIVLATGGVGGITVTLPAPTAGKIFNIKKIDAAAGAITIVPPSGTIDGAANKTISIQYASLTITSNGTNFFII